jgi:hypothetical protein
VAFAELSVEDTDADVELERQRNCQLSSAVLYCTVLQDEGRVHMRQGFVAYLAELLRPPLIGIENWISMVMVGSGPTSLLQEASKQKQTNKLRFVV